MTRAIHVGAALAVAVWCLALVAAFLLDPYADAEGSDPTRECVVERDAKLGNVWACYLPGHRPKGTHAVYVGPTSKIKAAMEIYVPRGRP